MIDSRFRLPAWLGSGVFLIFAGGCFPLARLDVTQPHLPDPQSHITLEGNWAYFAPSDHDMLRVLLAFPLPQSRHGDRHYYIYVRCPAHAGSFAYGGESDDSLSGLFLQSHGRYAGMTLIRGGTLNLGDPSGSCGGQFALTCEDGTELKGTFTAQRREWDVMQFEEQYRHYVRVLDSP